MSHNSDLNLFTIPSLYTPFQKGIDVCKQEKVEVVAYLDLHNSSQNYSVSYKIQTHVKFIEFFKVKPNPGLLLPSQTTRISFTLNTDKAFDFVGKLCSELNEKLLFVLRSQTLYNDNFPMNKFEHTDRLIGKVCQDSMNIIKFSIDVDRKRNQQITSTPIKSQELAQNMTMLSNFNATPLKSKMLKTFKENENRIGKNSRAEEVHDVENIDKPSEFYVVCLYATGIVQLVYSIVYVIRNYEHIKHFWTSVINAIFEDPDYIPSYNESFDKISFLFNASGNLLWIFFSSILFWGLLNGKKSYLSPWICLIAFSFITGSIMLHDIYTIPNYATYISYFTPLVIFAITVFFGLAAMILVWWEAREWKEN